MTISTQSYKPKDLNITGSVTSTITNKSLALANTEYVHVLQTGLKQLLIRCRETSTLKFSFVITESGTKYVTIPPGTTFSVSDLTFSGKTLYIRSTKASVIAEILEFY